MHGDKTMAKYILAIGSLALCAGVVLMLAGADIAPAAGPMWRAGPFTSPFQAVRWKDQTPQVKVGDVWYELIALNDVNEDQLIDWCKQLDPKDWQKRFEEDLPEVMVRMQHEPGKSATLKLKNTESGEIKTLDHVALTEENRRSIMMAKATGPATTQPGAMPWNGYPRLSPFTAVRWKEQTPEVQVNDAWYELVAINDVPADKIVAFSRSLGPSMTEKHFEENLIELLTRMGHTPGKTATLKLKELPGGAEKTLTDVPMTEANRQALWEARAKQDQ